MEFETSIRQFERWKKETGKLDSLMLWQIEFAGFLLQAYNDTAGQMVLFQIFSNGRGFKAYTFNREFVEQYHLKL